MNEETVYYKPEKGNPCLHVLVGNDIWFFPLKGCQTLGRPAGSSIPEIPVISSIVSRRHGQFLTGPAGCQYCDEGSTNGTIYNGRMLPAGKPQRISDGDVLRIHGRQDKQSEMDVLLLYSEGGDANRKWKKIPLGNAREIVIGRNEYLGLRDESVSRKHASLFLAEKGWALIDHGSKNGVFLNAGRLKEPVYLRKNDVIRIAGHYFVFAGDTLLYQADAASAQKPQQAKAPAGAGKPGRLDDTALRAGKPVRGHQPDQARKVTPSGKPDRAGRQENFGDALFIRIEERNVWQKARKKTLLRDINLDIPAGSMVLILGGSGAGKTTFMNAVMGYEPAKGEIRYAGTDIYREYERMKYEIGYVPQQDLLRMNDSVYDTLLNAARMRLPVMDQKKYELAVDQTLHLLGLEAQRDSLAVKLSGGQRKRLSIAVEYIGNPSLFFLDEPDSGLDGSMATKLMESLRMIADEGKIVLVISHSPDRAFDLFDKVIVLAKNQQQEGRLVYYGTPADTCSFFGVRHLEDIIGRINSPEEGGEGLADMFISKYESGNI